MKKIYQFLYATTFLIGIISIKPIQAEEFCAIDSCCPMDCCIFETTFTASYLYWRIQENHIEQTFKHRHRHNENEFHHSEHHFTSRPAKWDSGLRLELDVFNKNCNIGCNFGYIHFFNFSKDGKRKGDFHFACDQGYIDLETTFGCGCFFGFRSYIGVMVANFEEKQKFHVPHRFLDDSFSDNKHVKAHNNFFGVGPRIGLTSKWDLCNSLKLIGDLNFAYLFGNNSPKCNWKHHHHKGCENGNCTSCRHEWPMAGGSFGIEWKRPIYGCWDLTLALAWEFQYWWQCSKASKQLHNDLIFTAKWGNLFMQGLTVSAGVEF